MAIDIRLDHVLLDHRMTLTELADRVGITVANLSILKTGKARAIRLSTLDAICRELDCQPGDPAHHVPDDGSGDARHRSVSPREWGLLMPERTCFRSLASTDRARPLRSESDGSLSVVGLMKKARELVSIGQRLIADASDSDGGAP